MDVSTLSGLCGVALSLLFSYVPGFETWYSVLNPISKRLVMLLLLLVVSAAIMVVVCSGFATDFGLIITCDRAGFLLFAKVFIAALVANQATFVISPPKS